MESKWRRIYLCRQTIIEMLLDRGYLPNTTTNFLTPEEFMSAFPSAPTSRVSLNMTVVHSTTNEQLNVCFFDEEKVGLKCVKINLDNLGRLGVKNLIIVCKEGISPIALKHTLEYNNVEVFKEKDLLFNVTKHKLVPKHRLMTEEEKKNMLETRKIKESQLPRIMKSDPVARYFGVKRGDVFEITRDSETAGKSLYYRIVV